MFKIQVKKKRKRENDIEQENLIKKRKVNKEEVIESSLGKPLEESNNLFGIDI